MGFYDEDGLRVDVTGKEIVEMSEKSITYHLAKVEEFRAKAAEYRKLIGSLPNNEARGFDKGSYNSKNNPADEFDSSVRSHEKRAKFHQFLMSHVVLGTVYHLRIDELKLWGIVRD